MKEKILTWSCHLMSKSVGDLLEDEIIIIITRMQLKNNLYMNLSSSLMLSFNGVAIELHVKM